MENCSVKLKSLKKALAHHMVVRLTLNSPKNNHSKSPQSIASSPNMSNERLMMPLIATSKRPNLATTKTTSLSSHQKLRIKRNMIVTLQVKCLSKKSFRPWMSRQLTCRQSACSGLNLNELVMTCRLSTNRRAKSLLIW
jgi:hypothetical protein